MNSELKTVVLFLNITSRVQKWLYLQIKGLKPEFINIFIGNLLYWIEIELLYLILSQISFEVYR